jgi:pimeloyl-ACP methyl ester carboxylesterase
MTELYEEKAGPEGEIMVTRAGEGPALVMIHGITSGRWTWEPVIEHLAKRYELFVYDQRGHGSSMKPNHGYGLHDYATDLDLVLDHFGIERPLIIGHSLGGMVTLEWAIGQPDRAKALVIEDSPMRRGGPDTPELFEGWLALNAMTPEEAEAALLAKFPDLDPVIAKHRATSITSTARSVLTELREGMAGQNGASVIGTYSGITSPTLLVYGDVDFGGMVPESDAESFSATLPNGEAAFIVDGDHNLHLNKPQAFLDVVLPFLERHRD